MSTDQYKSSAWTGWVVFAAAVMFTIGAIDIIQGLAALLKDETYARHRVGSSGDDQLHRLGMEPSSSGASS